MTTPKNNVVYGLLAKTESAYGTYNTPASATDGIQVADFVEIERAYGFDGKRPSPPGFAGQQQSIAPQGPTLLPPLKIEDKGAGAVYSASVFPKDSHNLLLAGGMTATGAFGAGTEKWTYVPTLLTAAPTSLSLEYYLRASQSGTAEKWTANGVYCDWTHEATDGKEGFFTFNTFGRENADPVETAFPSITYGQFAVMPPPASPLVLTVNAVASLAIRSVKFEMRRVVQARYPDQNNAAAHAGFAVGERDPLVTFVCEAPLFATINFWSLYKLGTPIALSYQVGSVQYNRRKFTFAQGQIVSVKPSSEGPVPLMEIQYAPRVTAAGNDDISIVCD